MDFAKWISFITVIILIYIIWQIKRLILLAFTAIILALALNLVVKKLQDLGLKRSYGVLLSILSLLVVIFSFIILLVPSLIIQFQELFDLVPLGIDQLIFQVERLQQNLSPEINNLIPPIENILPQVQPILEDLLTRGINLVSGFLGGVLSSLLLLVLALMLLAEPGAYKRGFIRFFPNFYRPRVKNILNKMIADLEELLTDMFIKICAVMILTFICLYLLQIPLVFAQSLLAGILALMPYLGVIISVIFPMTISFIDSPWKPWFILIAYIIIHQLIDQFILPKLRSKRIIIIPGNIIVGEVIFANFLGVLGLFLALPLTIMSQRLIKEILIKDIFDRWQKK